MVEELPDELRPEFLTKEKVFEFDEEKVKAAKMAAQQSESLSGDRVKDQQQQKPRSRESLKESPVGTGVKARSQSEEEEDEDTKSSAGVEVEDQTAVWSKEWMQLPISERFPMREEVESKKRQVQQRESAGVGEAKPCGSVGRQQG